MVKSSPGSSSLSTVERAPFTVSDIQSLRAPVSEYTVLGGQRSIELSWPSCGMASIWCRVDNVYSMFGFVLSTWSNVL